MTATPTVADLDADTLRQLYGVEGLNLSTIARRLGSDVDSVRLACQRAGMHRRHRGRLNPLTLPDTRSTST